MKRAGILLASLLLLIGCSLLVSCERKPGRPDIFLFTWREEAKVFEGVNANGVVKQAREWEMFCTDANGYKASEDYIDLKEFRVRQLERELAQCKANK